MKFIFNKEDCKKFISEYFWLTCKPTLITAIIFFVLAIYFLLVGYLNDKDALSYGYPSLFIGVIFLFRMYIFYNKISNLSKAILKRNNKDGIIEYTFSCKDENTYEFCNLNSGSIINIKKNDITKIHVTKTFLLLELYTRVNIVLKKNEEFLKLFNIKK